MHFLNQKTLFFSKLLGKLSSASKLSTFKSSASNLLNETASGSSSSSSNEGNSSPPGGGVNKRRQIPGTYRTAMTVTSTPPLPPQTMSTFVSPSLISSTTSTTSTKPDQSISASNVSASAFASASNVFERLSKRTNSLKNLASSLSTTKPKGVNDTDSASEQTGEKGSSSNDEVHEEFTQTYLTSPNNSTNNSNNSNTQNPNQNLSKTSVFERLYKSNIAAHMNPNSQLLNETGNLKNLDSSTLKKNMSVSSASLTSSNNSSNYTSSLSVRNRPSFTSRHTVFQPQRFTKDLLNPNNDEVEESVVIRPDFSINNSNDLKKTAYTNDVNESVESSSSFLSHKLKDLFKK